MKFQNIIMAMMLLPLLIFTNCNSDDENGPDADNTLVTSSTPAQDAEEVNVNTTIEFTFSQDMDASTINVSSITLLAGTIPITGDVSYESKVATFTPTSDLAFSTKYTAIVSTLATSASGNVLDTAYTLSFTTAAVVDELAPFINSTDPIDNEMGVFRNKTVSILFNEPMDPATINENTFMVNKGTTDVAGEIKYEGTTAIFTPAAHFESNTIYTVTLTTGAKDLAGNTVAESSTWVFTTSETSAVLSVVDLGTAANYVILAKTAINNSSTSAITGDLGLSPAATSYITGLALTDFTGYATSAQVTGKVYASDMAAPTPVNLTTAVENMITAYNDAAGRPTPDFLELATGSIGGLTLTKGLYKWTNSVNIATDITISGTADDVWIFQIAGDLSQSTDVNIILSGGAQASNIFWQVAGEATLGATSHFEGNILSMTGITYLTGASMNGRALAQTAVILDANTITKL